MEAVVIGSKHRVADLSGRQPCVELTIRTRALASVLLVFLVSIVVATSTSASGQLSTVAWVVEYQISASQVEPNSSLGLHIRVQSQKLNYDFELAIIVPQPLKATKEKITFSQLSPDEIREELVLIEIPNNVQEAEIYVVNVRAQSHSDPPGALGLRSPLDNPEYVCDTTERPELALRISIVLIPHISIADYKVEPDSPKLGDEVTLSLRVSNSGTGIARGAKIGLTDYEGFSLTSAPPEHVLGDLAPGAEKSISWKLKAIREGGFHTTVVITGQNFEKISKDIPIVVRPPASWNLNLVVSLAMVIPAIIVIATIYRWKRESW